PDDAVGSAPPPPGGRPSGGLAGGWADRGRDPSHARRPREGGHRGRNESPRRTDLRRPRRGRTSRATRRARRSRRLNRRLKWSATWADSERRSPLRSSPSYERTPSIPTMGVHELSRTDARRIAVRAQLLTRQRPTDLHAVVRHLTLIQIEPTAAVAPNADLVLWSRLGSSYSPADLVAALEDQSLIELKGKIRPSEDIRLFRAEMAEWPGRGELREWQEEVRDWVLANDSCRLEILDR